MILELTRQGTNLNQIARKLNQGKKNGQDCGKRR
ncbi:plasmid mobilization relaxosome protein MobC [Levilactobacillus brevis]